MRPAWTYAIRTAKGETRGRYSCVLFYVVRNDEKAFGPLSTSQEAERLASQLTAWANQPWGIDK